MTADDYRRLERYHGEMILHHKKFRDHFTKERKALEKKQRIARAERTSASITNTIIGRLQK